MVSFGAPLLLLLLSTAVWQGHHASGQSEPHEPVSCPDLKQYTQTYSNCLPLTNCSGVLCHVMYPQVGLDTYVTGNASFVANKCLDPLTANVNVVLPDLGVDLNQTFSRSGNVSVGQPNPRPIIVRMSRDDTHMEIVIETVENGSAVYLVPQVYLPINTTQCLCQSMDNLSRDIQLGGIPGMNFQYSCERVSGSCDTVHCAVETYSADMVVDSCPDPPTMSVAVVNSNGVEVYSQLFDHSQTVEVSAGLTILVTIEDHEYSMDVKVSATYLFQTIMILPRHTIILDRSSCPEAPSSPTPPTTHPEICDSLSRISDSSSYCLTDDSCTAIECDIPPSGDHLEMTVLPCNNPPAIQVTVTELDGHVVYDNVVTNSALVPVPVLGNVAFYLNITVRHSDESITVKVDAVYPGLPTINVIPETTIPIDTTSCPPPPSVEPTSLPPSVEPTNLPPSVEPTEPVTSHPHTDSGTDSGSHSAVKTCDAVTTIAQSMNTAMDEPESQLPWQLFCHLKGTDCYEIACTAADTEHLSDADSLKLVFLNCQDPPALQMSSSGRTSFDYTFNDSRVLPISVDNTSSWLSVTLDHFPDDVIGLAVVLYLSPTSPNVTLIPYTRVPLGKDGCEEEEEEEEGGSVTVVIAVVVPVCSVLGLLVVVLVVVALWLLWRRWKRNRLFEPVRLTDMQDEDD